VLTEAEFLARRESVDRKMVIRQSEEYSQLAVLEDGVLVEHYVGDDGAERLRIPFPAEAVRNILRLAEEG